MNVFQWLCHILFGTQYVSYVNSCDDCIKRVRWMPNGKAYIKWCGTIIWLDGDEQPNIVRLTAE